MACSKCQGCAEQKKPNAQSVLVLIFAALAFAMILFSPFGPISSSLIPFHPMGWAGIFVFLAMVTRYSQKYQETKDNFWFILALMFFPVLISDLYFFPIPEIMGFGMAGWMGVQVAICFVCFAVVSKVKVLRYSNLSMLLLLPIAAVLYIFPQLGLSAILLILSFMFVVVIAVSLSYYAFLYKEYLLILGVILNFLVSLPIPNLYIITGFLPFGWTQPLTAVVTDRIAIFGRILMVLSLPMMQEFVQRLKNIKNNQ
jgi:hypothetical protein